MSEEVYEGYAVEEKAVPEDLETSEGRVVEVRFSEPLDDEELTGGEAASGVEAEASVDGQFVLSGFEVLGAIRQSAPWRSAGRIGTCGTTWAWGRNRFRMFRRISRRRI